MRRSLSVVSVVLLAPLLAIVNVAGLLLVYIAGVFGKKVRLRLCHFIYLVFSRGVVAATLSRVRVVGKENIPRGRPYVIYANHRSYIDIPVISGYIAPEAAYMAREGLEKSPIGRWVLAGDGVLIGQKSTKRELRLILTIIERVKAGRPFVVFPEGTRSRKGETGKLKRGSLKIAQKARAPLIPVRIVGTRQILPRGAIWPRPADVTVVIGPPVPPERIDENPNDVLDELSAFYEGKTKMEQ